MRFITAEITKLDFEDGQQLWAAHREYRKYLETIKPQLPLELQTLSDVNVHDGIVRRIIYYVGKGELEIRLRCGDNAVGYFDLNLHYFDVRLDRSGFFALRVWAADRRAELQTDEITIETDASGTPIYCHGFLYKPSSKKTRWVREGWEKRAYGYCPDREVNIRFSRLEWNRIPRPNRKIGYKRNSFTQVP